MNNGIVILFGASGDLARRKLIPALYDSWQSQTMQSWYFIGAALELRTIEQLLTPVKEHIQINDENSWRLFCERWNYLSINLTDPKAYKKIADEVDRIEKQQGIGARLLYAATAASLFCPITEYAAKAHIIKRQDTPQKEWHRIVYEKPFGHDEQSAQEINACIAQYVSEEQIYRIDHFLSKELVSNIALIRFTNAVFEPLWNNRYIDQIQIILNESIDIEDRGSFYDQYGAIADVMQNHMLEMLALVGMETPTKLTGNAIRAVRQEVLAKVEVVDGIRGQYGGYRAEKSVRYDSDTETFAAIMLRVNTPRWAGVPWFLKTGKKLSSKQTVIHIKFKQVDCLLLRHCPIPSNWLTITIAATKGDDALPDARFSLFLNGKKPGVSDELVSVAMEFCHSCIFGPSAGGYEQLLTDILRGDQSVAVGVAEISYAWRIVDEIRKKHFPLFTYHAHTDGPEEMKLFEQKHGMRWRS